MDAGGSLRVRIWPAVLRWSSAGEPFYMFLTSVHGVIERRVLLNYRLDPAAARAVLPAPFRPKLHQGFAVGGVCLIRFKALRPRFAPVWLGLGSENAAHRIAVEWKRDGQWREGVYIPRRDTDSRLNLALGGTLFPGIFRHRVFHATETESALSIRVAPGAGEGEIVFRGAIAGSLPAASIFASLEEASNFFLRGAAGYSDTRVQGRFHGMELRCQDWRVIPMAIEEARSPFFEDRRRFPKGAAELDCALLMRGIAHEWISQPDLRGSDESEIQAAEPAAEV